MNSTPASGSRAVAAATIWSGVGEVKICPGQAASSMPCPTNPACRGSCPLPPPAVHPPFPGFSRAPPSPGAAPPPPQEPMIGVEHHQISVAVSETVETFGNHAGGRIDELLH